MKDFLNKSKEKYYLSLGDYRFSPIMEASIALSLSYRELHLKNNQKLPFFLSFPEKHLASVWLSTSLLVNFFLEDYIDQSEINEKVNFVKGEKVEIFGSIAEIESVSNESITLKFSDQGGIPINKKLRKQINKIKNRRSINKMSLFIKNYKESKINRNPISKILEPQDSVIINENRLSSKVLIITGRGNSKQLRSILKTSEIYSESLSNIFIENKNLFIKKDLEAYKNIFNNTITDKEKLFKELLLKFLKEKNEINSTTKDSLIIQLESNEFLNTDFKEAFDDIVSFYREAYPLLIQISNAYPGIKETLPRNIKAVIINEIEQINIYKNTINGFLNVGIPVFVISDRHVQNSNQLTFLKDFFKDNPSAFRINWNKGKIKALNEVSKNQENYLDSKLWKSCLRYLKQRIQINTYDPNPLDELLYKTQKIVKNLSEFESIQKAYYKYLYPAAYLFKNSTKSNNSIFELTDLFDAELQRNKFLLPQNIMILLTKMVDFLKTSDINNKKITNTKNSFSNLLPVNLDRKVFIPNDCNTINIPDENSEFIHFSGYPYNEFSGSYLVNAVCSNYLPKVTVDCWPIESHLTYNYLRKRIMAGYFNDCLNENWELPIELILKGESDFENEISSFLKYSPINNSGTSTDLEQEADILAITSFKYKGFSNIANANHSYSVKCDILNFNDGSFLFLPKNSKVLAQIETDDGSLKIKNSLFSELEVGFKVFKYKKDRGDFRYLARNNSTIEKSFIELELWKKTLVDLYQANNSSLDDLEKLLCDKKLKNALRGNPSRNNIQRWLFDEELIAPEIDNITIIFSAAQLVKIDEKIENIQLAFSRVVSYTIKLSSMIKKSITNKLSKKTDEFENSFNLDIENVDIGVESRIITGLEKSEMEIDYHNTRRILI